jgi:signal transduction histidine kinase
VASGVRGLAAGLPPEWLDQLLEWACALPVAEGEDAVVSFLIDGATTMLSDVAIGTAFADDSGEMRVFRLLPHGRETQLRHAAEGQLFGAFPYERAFPLSHVSGYLAVASDVADDLAVGSSVSLFAERLAVVLGHGLWRARHEREYRRDSFELQVVTSKLVETEKLASLGQIAAGIVHELNNPLTSIIAYADLLAKRLPVLGATAEDLERLHRIHDSAGRMLQFTRELVTYARPAAEPPRSIDAARVVEQAVAFCEHVLDAAGVSLDRQLPPALPAIWGRESELIQVFVNLLSNAAQALEEHVAAPGPRRIQVVMTPTPLNDGVVIVLEDNGPGIPPEQLIQVFTPFFTTKAPGKGTGLGLSIVRNIVDRHDGSIVADRGDLGGARFTLRLPARRA